MRLSRVCRLSVLFSCAIWIISILVTPLALAGDWKLTDSFSSGLTWSSNPARDDPEDEEGGLFFTVSPAFTLTGTGRRASAEIAYRPAFAQRLVGGNDTGIVNFLDAAADIEAVSDHLFVNLRATGGPTNTSGRASSFGLDAISIASDSDVDQTYTLAVSPEWRNRFGSFADSSARASLSRVDSGSSTTSNSTGIDLAWLVSSGRDFPRFPWSVQFSNNIISYDDRSEDLDDRSEDLDDQGDDRRTLLTGQIDSRHSRQWLLRALGGYEDNDVVTSRSETNGFVWGLGGVWTPNVRTVLDIEYSQRYFGSAWEVGFSHRKKRVTITADLSRGISNARETLRDIQFIAPGKPIPPPIVLPPLDDEDFLEEAVDLSIALQGKRTRAAMNVRWSDRKFEVSRDKEDVLDLNLVFSRRLASDLSADFNFYWQHVGKDANVDSESTLVSSFGLSKALGRRTSVGVSLSHRDEDGEGGDSSTENRIAINITTSFL